MKKSSAKSYANFSFFCLKNFLKIWEKMTLTSSTWRNAVPRWFKNDLGILIIYAQAGLAFNG